MNFRKYQPSFLLLIFLITSAMILIAIAIQLSKGYFPYSDFANLASILQGTIGIAVSFAGALVAIKLAKVSTLIIEKEKSREDIKFYFDVISDSLLPYRQLADSIANFYIRSMEFTQAILDLNAKSQFSDSDYVIEKEVFHDIKLILISHLEEVLSSLQGIQNNTISHALWFKITSKRFANSGLITRGGSVRVSERKDISSIKGDGYLIEDLIALIISIKLSLKIIRELDIEKSDIILCKKLIDPIFEKVHRSNFLFSADNYNFMLMTTLSSLVMNNSYKKPQFNFRHKYLSLLIDLSKNLPEKDDLLLFSKELFSSDDEIMSKNPHLNSFDILGDAYWFPFIVRGLLVDTPLTEEDLGFNERNIDETKSIIKWYQERLNVTFKNESLAQFGL